MHKKNTNDEQSKKIKYVFIFYSTSSVVLSFSFNSLDDEENHPLRAWKIDYCIKYEILCKRSLFCLANFQIVFLLSVHHALPRADSITYSTLFCLFLSVHFEYIFGCSLKFVAFFSLFFLFCKCKFHLATNRIALKVSSIALSLVPRWICCLIVKMRYRWLFDARLKVNW